MVKPAIAGVMVLVLLGAATVPAAADEAYPELMPAPGLSPQDVVRIQLDALRHNDSPFEDAGVQITYRFASPTNRRTTGPLERFTRIVYAPAYRPMIDHRELRWGPVSEDGDQAQVGVILDTAGGGRAAYVFGLSRQHEAPYAGCWMTDRVDRVPLPPETEARSPAAI